MNQNQRHRRDCVLFSIDTQFPKLDVAGSIPVSRFSFQDVSCDGIPAVSVRFQMEIDESKLKGEINAKFGES
jgi:hypothetical protein